MKKYFYMAVAAIVALSSCSNDNEFEPNQSGKQGGLVFTATMEGSEGTRATYNSINKCAEWEEGDQIDINGKTYSAQTAGTTTTFKADDGGATGETYNAYFPANLYNNGMPTLPAKVSETWVEGKFNMPMYATSETTNLTFKNLCGVLKITVKSDQLTSVKCITVSSTNCATSGAFSVDANTYAAKLTNPSNTANTVTVTYTDAVTTDATGKVFYVAIPAQTYQELSIAVSDGTTTKVMITSTNKNIQIARNTVYTITFNGQPTTGTAMTKDNVSVNWVQLWAGGPKFADRNVGASSVTETGTTMTFAEATAENFTWGPNWCAPNKDQMDELLKSASGDATARNNAKVTCKYCEYTTGDGKWGFKFTGKGAYASNSVFFPAQQVGGYYGNAGYWSATADGSKAWLMYLVCNRSDWYSNWNSYFQDYNYLVRPVLKN